MTAWLTGRGAAELLLGVVIGLLIPKSVVREIGGVMRQRVNGWVHDHFVETICIILIVALLGAGAGLLGLGYALSSARSQNDATHALAQSAKQEAAEVQAKFNHYRTCVNHYAFLNHKSQTERGNASQKLDDARSLVETDSRRLWQLIAESVGGHKVSPTVAKKALGIYLSDSAQEQRLHAALTQARLKHPIPVAPDQACK